MNDEERTAQEEANTFIEHRRSLVLSTLGSDGFPEASYAPFVSVEQRAFYIYISTLSAHTRNLGVNPVAGVLFIEDESATQQIFARKRLSFRCTVRNIERTDIIWSRIMQSFATKFGEVMALLRSLDDFQLYKLVPGEGAFVKGFAQAFRINAQNKYEMRVGGNSNN